jgi:hypothetical protein
MRAPNEVGGGNTQLGRAKKALQTNNRTNKMAVNKNQDYLTNV